MERYDSINFDLYSTVPNFCMNAMQMYQYQYNIFTFEILYVMTVFNDANGHMRRELVVITERKDLYAVTEEFLLNKTNLQLSLVKEEESKKHSTGKRIVKFFSQGNIGASRKQMQPFVQTLYSTLQL